MGKEELLNKFFRWMAHIVPKRLAYFCAVRIFAFATSGKYDDDTLVVPDLSAMTALMRWDLQEEDMDNGTGNNATIKM